MKKRYHVATSDALYGVPMDLVATFDKLEDCLCFMKYWAGGESLVYRDTFA